MRYTKPLALLLVVAASMLVGCDGWMGGDPEPVMTPAPAPAPTSRTAPAPRPVASSVRIPQAPPGYASLQIAQPTGRKSDSVVLIQKFAPKEVVVGKEFDYILTITNLSPMALNDVTLTGKLPATMQVSRSQPAAAMGNQTATWQIARLAPKETQVFRVYGSATQVGNLTHCSEVTFRLAQECLTIRAVQPALQLALTMPPEVIACDPIPVKLVVTNTGTGDAMGVRVRQNLPEGMTVQGKSALAFDVGNLAQGESKAFRFEARAARPGQFVTKAAASAAGDLASQAQASTVVRQPVLAVAIAGPANRFVNRPATYAVTVNNTGDGVARETVVAVRVPAGAELLAADGGGQRSGDTVVWKLGNLAANDTRKVSLTLKAVNRGALRPVVTAKAHCAEASAQTQTMVKGIPAILLECVDVDDPIEVGAMETYLITVTNQGSADGTNIVISCSLPAAQAFVSAAGPTQHRVAGNTITFAALPSLAPKAKQVYKVVIKGVGTGDTRFRVTLTSDQIDSPVEETESTHIYE